MQKTYIRVGTQYWLKTEKPLASGDTITKLIPWSKGNIKDDEPDRDIFKNIPKYVDFVCIPGHLNYCQTIGDFYNLYEPFAHTPQAGDCTHSLAFMRHIFGEHYDLGMDYMKLLLDYPTQKLPVLALVSRERNTGKTTFLNWLKEIYRGNMSICRSKDFESNFNAEWVYKRIIAIDETFLEKKATTETLKNLSTAHTIVSEAKGKDREQVEFHGVIVLCTNNETDFVRIDEAETRYWVRKIERLPQDDPHFLAQLKAEIPAFLHFLSTWQLTTHRQGRMWFTQEQIWTEALERLKAESRNALEKELELILMDKLETYELPAIAFTEGDLLQLLKVESHFNCVRSQISKVLREQWGLTVKNSTYKYYYWTIGKNGETMLSYETRKGKYYVFTPDLFKSKAHVSSHPLKTTEEVPF
jgi:hypothetical protein